MRLAFALLALTTATQAQWQLQQSNTTADLRGIHSLGNGVAWASGSKGTVLRTTDNGTTWQPCAVPPGAEGLDFRGIQAFDTKTAIVMSSGKGDLSRLYKTRDGCMTWKLVATNPDKEGFWDAIQIDREGRSREASLHNHCFGAVVGDPVDGFFPMFLTFDCGNKWERQLRRSPSALPGEGLFAASNQAMLLDGVRTRSFVTGSSVPRLIRFDYAPDDTGRADQASPNAAPGSIPITFEKGLWDVTKLPVNGKPAQGAGAFAIAQNAYNIVVVGGDYALPSQSQNTAWYLGSQGWLASKSQPHGYRSAVAFSASTNTWVTVGPNGTDLSTDDGRNWHPLNPTADESQHWNALSLPFVVGPHGRIGLLRPEALKP